MIILMYKENTDSLAKDLINFTVYYVIHLL